MSTCTECGNEVMTGEVCEKCGRRDLNLNAEHGRYVWTVFEPTVIIDGRDPQTGDLVVRVNAPGATSATRLTADGAVSLNVTGARGVGRPGEPQALKTLRQRLQGDGLTVTVSRNTDRDAWGEDATMTIDGASTPWYGSARLYRQSKCGDWSDVFAEVARDLAALVAERMPSRGEPQCPSCGAHRRAVLARTSSDQLSAATRSMRSSP